jgi:hypothetical protein
MSQAFEKKMRKKMMRMKMRVLLMKTVTDSSHLQKPFATPKLPDAPQFQQD